MEEGQALLARGGAAEEVCVVADCPVGMLKKKWFLYVATQARAPSQRLSPLHFEREGSGPSSARCCRCCCC